MIRQGKSKARYYNVLHGMSFKTRMCAWYYEALTGLSIV